MASLRDPSDISRGIEKTPISLENPGDLEDVSDFVYVACSIPGPVPLDEEFRDLIRGCECQKIVSCGKRCKCVARFGPCYTEAGLLAIEDGPKSHHKPVYECNKNCKCSINCTNRVVQHGVTIKLTVFRTQHKGYGLKTCELIRKNTFVCEYAGEYLTHDIAKKRTKSLSMTQDSNYYILALKEHLGSGKTISTYIDPMFVGNVGRFINHSCEPNLFMVPVRIHNNTPRLALFALQDITPEEELTFHYGGTNDKKRSKLSTQSSSGSQDVPVLPVNTSQDDIYIRPCHCGATNCSGFLPFDKDLFDT